MKNTEKNQIHCPKCGEPIDVNEVLKHQLEEQLRSEYNKKLAENREELEKKQEVFEKARDAFEQEKREQRERFNTELEAKLKVESKDIEAKLKAKIADEQSEQFSVLQKELEEKSEQVKELFKTKAEISKLQREKDELKLSVEAELEQKLNQTLIEEKEKIRKTEEERNSMKLLELQKQLEDQKKLTEEMKRKQEQGSMQLQGEVQELAIEDFLRNTFRHDSIDEVGKGANGADCLQTVNTLAKQNCGTIYYESKRAKDFKPAWIEKFKEDMREKGADIGVIVTAVMPSGMQRMGMRDGIWICTMDEFKGLSYVLRETLIKVSDSMESQENKSDKMVMLYDYLTSNAFRMLVEAIVEAFSGMKVELDKEKRAMKRMWKQREKQIEKVITSTIEMYGSIRGIAGNAVQSVPALELPGFNDDFEDEEDDED
jgi:hypothetical protein